MLCATEGCQLTVDKRTSPTEMTQLLSAWNDGDPGAFERLMTLVWDELHRMARGRLMGERPGHTLQPTALVNEVYLRFAGERTIGWRNRAHFFGACAEMMRRILVDHARKHQAKKRGGGATHLALDELEERIGGEPNRLVELLALDEALRRLEAMDPRQGRIIELRFFAGLTLEETAEVMGVSISTVKNEWTKAKVWLFQRLHGR
jgi:RNA polymerase sigma-70 factor (ECF subfamily)